jgi:malate dehydrogenase (quinone)
LQDALDTKKDVDVFFRTEVKKVSREDGHYVIETSSGILRGESIIFTSGPYSLAFAQTLGYGRDLAILPVAGSFYFSKKVPNGKIYPMQKEGMSFAEHHLDPDVTNSCIGRFGPTAKVVAEMERRNPKTFFAYIMRTPVHTPRGIYAIAVAMFAKVPIDFVFKNIVYDMPIVGKWLFLKSARKTVPLLRYSDLTLGKELGGVRPQIVNMKTRRLEMGEARIVGNKNGDKIIANTTPSPGASKSMKNGELDARQVVLFLGEGFWFDEEKFRKDFPRREI